MAKDLNDPKEFRGKWFEISEDELNHRMELKKKLQDDPAAKAVEMIDAALEKVLVSLGVRPEFGNIPAQQDALGILVTENTDERTPQLNGFFVYTVRGGEMIPYAWVGSARVDTTGDVLVDINWFQGERLTTVGGMKLRRMN